MKYILLITLIAFCTASCNDWLDVRPETEQKEEDQFSTVNGFWDALTGCYMTMAGSDLYGERLMYSNIESLANQWYMPEDMTRYEDEDLSKHDYTTDYSRSAIEAMYSGLFSAIVQANMLIKYADERADVFTDESMRAVVQGEAYAIRAYCQFDVLRLFGQVPQGSRQVELPYSYTTSIYEMPAYYGFGKYVDLLKEDIAKALELLEKNDPLFEYSFAELNTNISLLDDHLRYRQSRLNYWAVKALEARLHLYVGETADAYRVAMEVINAKGPDGSSVMELSGQADLESGYLAMPHECLFYVSKFDLHDEAWSILQGPEDQSFRPSTTLVITQDMFTNLYQDVSTTGYNRAGDMWTQVREPGSSLNYYTLQKYAWDDEAEESTMTTRQLLPMLRMAELYLIAMEGAPSMTEVNELYSVYMEDHGIAPTMLTPLADEQALKTFLLNEYRREFFGEGQMFYTYKRTNTTDVQWMEAEMEDHAIARRHGARGYLYDNDFVWTAIENETLTVEQTVEWGLLSVFSLEGRAAGIDEAGVQYPLSRASLTAEFPLGVSNHIIAPKARITVRQGALLVGWELPPTGVVSEIK